MFNLFKPPPPTLTCHASGGLKTKNNNNYKISIKLLLVPFSRTPSNNKFTYETNIMRFKFQQKS